MLRAVSRFLALLLLGVATGCSAPPELHRPIASPEASAASLLPPGNIQLVRIPGATDGASSSRADGERMIALRFPSVVAAEKGFDALSAQTKKRADISRYSSVSIAGMSYMKYAVAERSGLIWAGGVWLFLAEARSPQRLSELIAVSAAGGTSSTAISAGEIFQILGPGTLAALAITFLVVFACFPIAARLLTVKPVTGAPVVPRGELVKRLLALNDAHLPYIVRDDPKADLVVEWKYADVAWWAIMAKNRLRKIYRLRLFFDESRHFVYGQDELGTLDWSAGLTGAPQVRFGKSRFRGVVLFRSERGVGHALKAPLGSGFGKVLDYRFNINDVKGPVTRVIAEAGWTFRPVFWAPHKSAPVPLQSDKHAS